MTIKEIIKNIGKTIITPKGNQLLAGFQIGVLNANGKLIPYPNSIFLICWSIEGGLFHHCAIDCKKGAV